VTAAPFARLTDICNSVEINHHKVARPLRRCERIAGDRPGALPLKEIAPRVGFCDESHLSHAFRRHLKMPPGYSRKG